MTKRIKGTLSFHDNDEFIEKTKSLAISYDEKEVEAQPELAALALMTEAVHVMSLKYGNSIDSEEAKVLQQNILKMGDSRSIEDCMNYSLEMDSFFTFVKIMSVTSSLLCDFQLHNNNVDTLISDESKYDGLSSDEMIHEGLSVNNVFSVSFYNLIMQAKHGGLQLSSALPIIFNAIEKSNYMDTEA